MITTEEIAKTGHTQLPWKANIARMSPESEVFGFTITAAGKCVPLASLGVAIPPISVIIGKEYRRLPFADEYYTPEEVEANAHLIAAAPELLKAIKYTLPVIKKMIERMDATGEILLIPRRAVHQLENALAAPS